MSLAGECYLFEDGGGYHLNYCLRCVQVYVNLNAHPKE